MAIRDGMNAELYYRVRAGQRVETPQYTVVKALREVGRVDTASRIDARKNASRRLRSL